MAQIRVLLFAANTIGTTRLALDEEIRLIRQMIRLSDFRDELEIRPALAARPDDLLQELNEYRPHVVHFSGHGDRNAELAFVGDSREAKPVTGPALVSLFRTLKDDVRVVVLNACHSEGLARALSGIIDCAIGMDAAIGDEAAIRFSAAFYRAIGFGRTVREAFDQGVVSLQLEGIDGAHIPQLFCGSKSADAIRLTGSSTAGQPEPPILGRGFLTGSTLTLVGRGPDGERVSTDAFPLERCAILNFDLTNPNKLDMRLHRLFVDVVSYTPVDIESIELWIGAAMEQRRYDCIIDPKPGSYECTQIDKGYDYLRLSSGELEHIGVTISAKAEGVYGLAVGIEYAVGSSSAALRLADAMVTAGFFNDSKHKIKDKEW